jgi:hypothetical protein
LAQGEEAAKGENMKTFRRPSRSLGTLCLSFLLCTAPFEEKVQALASDALQTASPAAQLKPALVDEYQKPWSQVFKNARVATGPKLKNPAISSDGLPPEIVSALQEQRSYLETHAAAFSAQPPINAAARELVGDNSPKPRSPSQGPPCHDPMIRSVNGKTNGVVFTPTAANNRYRIEGCFFGDAPGIVQLEARSGPHQIKAIPPIPMQLDSTSLGPWSDQELNVQIDTDLRGIFDYPVTLVIYPAKHRRIELPNCRFVAARGNPQLLSVIPSAWVSLYPSGVGSRSIRQLEYVSPTQAGGLVLEDATASSAFVVRSDRKQFGIGRDNYDFRQLNPGWVVDSVQLQTYSVSCPEVGTSTQSFGHWEAAWTLFGVSVAFEDSLCTSSVLPSSPSDMSLSQYAIRVWVVGPVGTPPLALTR